MVGIFQSDSLLVREAAGPGATLRPSPGCSAAAPAVARGWAGGAVEQSGGKVVAFFYSVVQKFYYIS